MIGKINKDGLLLIKRKEIWKEQFCPYDSDRICGEHCPAFNDDGINDNVVFLSCVKESIKIYIEINER